MVLRYTGVEAVKTIPLTAKRYAVTTTLPMIESGDVGKAVEVWQNIVDTKEDAKLHRVINPPAGETAPATAPSSEMHMKTLNCHCRFHFVAIIAPYLFLS